MLGSIMGSALQGLTWHRDTMARHAHHIANWGTQGPAEPSPVNLETELVGVLTARRGAEANLAVVRAADDMLGTLLDVLA